MIFIGLDPDATVLSFLTPVSANKIELLIHRFTPYIHPRFDSRIEPNFSDSGMAPILIYFQFRPSSI